MAMTRFVLALALLASCLAQDNLNGDYVLSPTGGADPNATRTLFPTHFKDYPGGVDFFDVHSPTITSLYSQVFWKGLEPVDIPEEIVKKYDGKGMAVVGFEVDQVRRTPQGDVSVPINVAYNHHFESNMIGKKARFQKIQLTGPHDPRIAQLDMGHGLPAHGEHWIVEDLAPSNSLPTSQSFGAANGGEYRKSFHGYAPGFVQVLESPTQMQITPMQIDTWHREKMNVTGGSFVAGPLPRNSLAAPDAQYSGLLECPVSTRLRKMIQGGYTMQQGGSCKAAIRTASECFQAASTTLSGSNFTNTAGSSHSEPAGCTATADSIGHVAVYFNEAPSSVSCSTNAAVLSGSASSLVSVGLRLRIKQQEAIITLKGPSDVWFGVGFNATAMKDAPWSIIVDGSGKVSEHKLADQGGPPTSSILTPTIQLVSSKVEDGSRTVVLSRTFKGPSEEYFSFSEDITALPFINAVGTGALLAYHKNKELSTLTLLPEADAAVGGACICASEAIPFGAAKGTLEYVAVKAQPADTGSGQVGFGNRCAPQPTGDLLAMKNPTCDLRSYTGGQIACHHMWSLLDADQEIPWLDQPLEYSLKFRFWVQEYNPSVHRVIKRTTWGIGSPVEYDVPKCSEGVMGCEQQPDGNWVHTITGIVMGQGRLVAAHYHCHAPTCLSVTMYNNHTGEVICQEKPLYGGTGVIDNKGMDEPGFIAQPPCLWGSKEHGLEAPLDVTGIPIHVIKTANATSGHHGEMAWLQMFYY